MYQPLHKNIRTTVRYTHVGYEQTRQTAEALVRFWDEDNIAGVIRRIAHAYL